MFEDVLGVEGEAQQSKGSYVVTMECSENVVQKKEQQQQKNNPSLPPILPPFGPCLFILLNENSPWVWPLA